MASQPCALATAYPDLMRVLSVGNMYPPHHQGGYELIWHSSDEQLRTLGHEVRTLTTDHVEPGVPAKQEEHVRRQLRWYWREYAWPRLGLRERIVLERHNARVLDAQLAEFRPEAIAWWSMGGMSLSLLERARRAGIPGVGVICDEWLVYGPAVDQWIRLFERRPRLRPVAELVTGVPAEVDLAASARYLFLSDVLRRDAAATDGRFAAGEIVHRGPDAEHFRAAPAGDWRWRLAYVGRIDPRKGIDTAIETLGLLPPEATLQVVGGGDPSHLAEMRALAASLGVDERVSFGVASRQELQDVYARADAVVFPVRWKEPWGLVPLEAMAVGTPVVASGMGGSGEYLEHGRNCLLFDLAEGPRGLAGRVRELADDPRLRRQLRDGGLATAGNISAERFNERIEAALAAATDEPRSGDI